MGLQITKKRLSRPALAIRRTQALASSGPSPRNGCCTGYFPILFLKNEGGRLLLLAQVVHGATAHDGQGRIGPRGRPSSGRRTTGRGTGRAARPGDSIFAQNGGV